MDVARFKYPSYWISAELAWDSMLPLDKATGLPRGYCMLSPLPESDPSSLSAPLSLTTLTLNKVRHALLAFSRCPVLILAFVHSPPGRPSPTHSPSFSSSPPNPLLTPKTSSKPSLSRSLLSPPHHSPPVLHKPAQSIPPCSLPSQHPDSLGSPPLLEHLCSHSSFWLCSTKSPHSLNSSRCPQRRTWIP